MLSTSGLGMLHSCDHKPIPIGSGRRTDFISTALGPGIYTDNRNNGFTYRTTQHGVFSSIAYHF